MKQIRINSLLAMTMIELLVTIGIVVVVLGLALGILVESDRTTRRLTQLHAAAQYCDQTLSAATAMIEGAVAADNIKTSDTQTLAQAQTFKSNELQMLAYSNGVLYRVNLSPRPGEGIVIKRDPVSGVGSAGAGAVTPMDEKASAIAPAGFKPNIRFAYAGTTPPGQRPRYQDAWTSPGWPALIQVQVEAKLDAQGQPPIVLETAAIPGLVPARNVKEARP